MRVAGSNPVVRSKRVSSNPEDATAFRLDGVWETRWMRLVRVAVVVALIGACADGGVFPEGSSRSVVESDLGSSPAVPTSVADVAVTGTLVRPVASSSTGVPE